MSNDRNVQAEAGAWVGIIGNLLLASMKGSVGWFASSNALMADAFHSVSDAVGSIAGLVGIRTKDRSYRRAKADCIAAIIVSILLVFVGYEIARGSLVSILSGVSRAPHGYAVLAILISIVVKEAMFLYKYKLSKRLGHQVLIEHAGEHRSDVYSSLATLIGVGGALVGEWQGISWLLYLDPIAGLVIAMLVLRMGYRFVIRAIRKTLNNQWRSEDTKELVCVAADVPGVISVHDLRARDQGHYVRIEVTICVDPRISVLDGYRIGKRVKNRFMDQLSHISDVMVHVNPYDPGYPYKSNHLVMDDEHPTILQ
ncbi:cation-efflux pump [Paenibacillus selenitireducens]|uniref:Cation-efflux pump n=1 Tax=Paenibacillus selenitireducens TaxID=1324314 RepID=A0A1T2XKI1_9BACL|nr:cation diffusion facilitator family transporter [Paenibacillus selenitireducens]OPA80377.1 cation-efflux pump [Paenibacillus selenitireducens]